MVTMNDSLMTLVKNKVIDAQEALMMAVNKSEFGTLLAREGLKTAVAEE